MYLFDPKSGLMCLGKNNLKWTVLGQEIAYLLLIKQQTQADFQNLQFKVVLALKFLNNQILKLNWIILN